MLRADFDDLDGFVVALEAVHPDHHTAARLDRLLEAVGALLDGVLGEPGFDGRDGAPPAIDLLDQGRRPGLQLGGQGLDQVAAAHRVRDARHVGLVSDDLLGPHREGGRHFRGQPERLVERVGVQTLRPAEHRAHRLQGHPHDVVVRLLGGEGAAAGLGMEAQSLRPRVGDAVALLQQPGPQGAGGPELGDLLEEIGENREEEGEARGKRPDLEAGRPSGLHVGDGVRHGEAELLDRRGPRFAQVIAGNGDGVPVRQPLLAIPEDISGEAH